MNTDQYWAKSPFPTDELQDRRVEFDLTGDTQKVSGLGKFRVRERPDGEQCIEIVVTLRRSDAEFVDHILTLLPFHSSRIGHHPDASKAEFRCVA